MNPRTKIKVCRLALIAALQEKATAMEQEVEIESASYEAEQDAYAVAMVEFLEGLAEKAAEGHEVTTTYSTFRVDGVPQELPDRPHKPSLGRDYTGLTSSIKQLSMSPDETIAISVEDFGKYLGSV